MDNRGLEAAAIAGVGYGRFGRMFPFAGRSLPDDCLQQIADAMTFRIDIGKPINELELVDENVAEVPAGYTYFGQFVDHDLSLDAASLKASNVDVAALDDFRTPALDLDCVYGRGPDDQPYLYEDKGDDGLCVRLGKPLDASTAPVQTTQDILRLKSGNSHPAILGDKRNDENRIVAQIQGLMIRFHNRVIGDKALISDFGGYPDDPRSRFRTAVDIVRWHYQWLVLNDFLPRVLDKNVLAKVRNAGGAPNLENYEKSAARWAYIPVEFAGAAYRFGHSMVRPSYTLNMTAGANPKKPKKEQPDRIPIFSDKAGSHSNLNGFGVPVPHDWGIDWAFFFDGLDKTHLPDWFQVPQPSYRIDANLVSPLTILPEFRSKDDRPKKPSIFRNLAYRNLVRGCSNLRLPSGEQVALALGEPPLSSDIVWSAGSQVRRAVEGGLSGDDRKELTDVDEKRQAVLVAWPVLKGNTPLWYYILREAEWYGVDNLTEPGSAFGGRCLGPVGSRIVAETFVGVLANDPTSILNRRPKLEPHPTISGGDPAGFCVGRLAKYALS